MKNFTKQFKAINDISVSLVNNNGDFDIKWEPVCYASIIPVKGIVVFQIILSSSQAQIQKPDIWV